MTLDPHKLLADLKGAQTMAREESVRAIRMLEQALKSMAPLRGMPMIGCVDGVNFRGVRFRTSPARRAAPLRRDGFAHVLSATGEFLVVEQERSRLLQDDEILAEDVLIAVELVGAVVQRHTKRMQAGEANYQRLLRFAGELKMLAEKMAG